MYGLEGEGRGGAMSKLEERKRRKGREEITEIGRGEEEEELKEAVVGRRRGGNERDERKPNQKRKKGLKGKKEERTGD